MNRSFDELVGLADAPLAPRPEPRRFDIIFLDRDGTLNVHRPGYIETPDQLEVLPGVAEAVAKCAELAHRVVVVTNQRGIARGVMSLDDLAAVHAALDAALALGGGGLDAYGVCPHEENSCDCRKPLPGLFTRFFARMPWADPQRCVMVGDQDSDAVASAATDIPFRRITERSSLLDIVREFG